MKKNAPRHAGNKTNVQREGKERERGEKIKQKEGEKERYTERNKVETQQREGEASSA